MNISANEFFRALADPTRLRCLALLTREDELCVCEFTHALGLSQPKISRHLAQLREAGVVLDRRQGLWIYYRLHPQLPTWAREVIETTAAGVAKEAPFVDDQTALSNMSNRPGTSCCA